MAMYHSTRSHEPMLTSKEAIRRGIAPDGGLYVSDDLGSRTVDIAGLASRPYDDIAREVLGALLPDYSPAQIAACVKEAYGSTFASDEVTPVVPLKGTPGEDSTPAYVLELWHGPTSAFKDVALQMLPRLMARTGEEGADAAEQIMIVTATSGDTGKAALAGFAGAPGVGITVFYPEGKVSRVQELQMSTQEGSNVSVCAVRGNFDDAQSAVKRIFADRELAERLDDQGVVLSSANSINVGRLVPQVVYYFAAYAQLLRAGAIEPGDAVEFCVPTGNFGDILAGYYPAWTSSSRPTSSACSITCPTGIASWSPASWVSSPTAATRCPRSCSQRSRRSSDAIGRTRTRSPRRSRTAGTATAT